MFPGDKVAICFEHDKLERAAENRDLFVLDFYTANTKGSPHSKMRVLTWVDTLE